MTLKTFSSIRCCLVGIHTSRCFQLSPFVFPRSVRNAISFHVSRLMQPILFGPAASERNQNCWNKASSEPKGVGFLGGAVAPPYPPAKGPEELCKPTLGPRTRWPKVLVHFGFFGLVVLHSCYAKTVCKPAVQCGLSSRRGKDTFAPWFQNCGGEHPRCPCGFDAFRLPYSLQASDDCLPWKWTSTGLTAYLF